MVILTCGLRCSFAVITGVKLSKLLGARSELSQGHRCCSIVCCVTVDFGTFYATGFIPDWHVQPSAYISVMLVPEGGEIDVDLEKLAGMGIRHVVCSLQFKAILLKTWDLLVHVILVLKLLWSCPEAF